VRNSPADTKVRDERQEGGAPASYILRRGPHQHGYPPCIPWRFDHQSRWMLPKVTVTHCGIISKIMVLHLKIKVYMKNVAVFTH